MPIHDLFAVGERHLPELDAKVLMVDIMTWWQSKVEDYFCDFDGVVFEWI